MGDYHNLLVYQRAFQFALDIHLATTNFPIEERYGLIGQIRRSSKSICAILAEAYVRRHQARYFDLKLGEMYGEHAETQVWLDFANACGYLQPDNYNHLTEQNQEIGRLIRHMINHPEKFN